LPRNNHLVAALKDDDANNTPTHNYAKTTNDRLHLIYADFATDTGKIFTNLTGRFIQPSISGHPTCW
jgi:hypothetical protein